MISNIQNFRDKLAAGKTCLGSGITFSDIAVSEALACTVDFLWLDLEHNPTGLETLLGHLVAARTGEAAALVRVPGSEIPFLKRVLDTGAEGIIVPQVRSAAEVQNVVSWCRYPPQGQRGWGPRRPSNYGRIPAEQYREEANQQLFVVAQIETVDALNDLDNIVAIEGLDSLVIGPHDLAGSMGLPGQVSHPDIQAAMETITRKAHDAGKYVGIGMDVDEQRILAAVQMGIDWIQLGSDYVYLTRMAEQLVAGIRQKLSP